MNTARNHFERATVLMSAPRWKRFVWCAIWLTAILAHLYSLRAQSVYFSTLAGYAGQTSVDGPISTATFLQPGFAAVDPAGNIYVTDTTSHTIRKITFTGSVVTLAGRAGISGNANGVGTNALFSFPVGIVLDSNTNLFVCDSGNNTIREITPAGLITTFAGQAGIGGNIDATGTNATFLAPLGLAIDTANNLYVADSGNHTIRKITSAGAVTTLAGSAGSFGSLDGVGTNALFYQPQAVAVDVSGNVYVADTANATIRKITSGASVSTIAGSPGNPGSLDATGTNALFYSPKGIAVDAAANVYVADSFNDTIRQISPAGVVKTIAGITTVNGSVDGSNTNSRFSGPQGVTIDASGNLIIADSFNGTLRKIAASGTNWITTTVAGKPSNGWNDGANSAARFNSPQTLAVDGIGNIYIADTGNSVVRKISPGGTVLTIAGSAGVRGSVNGTGTNALFSSPQGVAVTSSGTVYVADTGNHVIRKIASGVVTTLAGAAGTAGSLDGTGPNALFYQPQALTVDTAGNVFVADTLNNSIRKITSAGVVTTLAGFAGHRGSFDGKTNNARFNWPQGITVDTSGNLYLADRFNHTLRKITQAGVVTTIAGWPGIWGSSDATNSSAQFYQPTSVCVDGSGNLYVIDSGNHTVRKLAPSGTNYVATTVAGTVGAPGSADGMGSNAAFNNPTGIAMSSSGALYVADAGNNTIRSQILPPSITGQPQNRTNLVGSPAPFSVIATGGGPLFYQWLQDGTSLGYSSGFLANAPGTYSVIVSNVAGTVISLPATLVWTNAAGIQPAIFQSVGMTVSGSVQLNLQNLSGSYALQASSNLVDWVDVTSFTNYSGNLSISDTNVLFSASRFYRVVYSSGH